MGRIGVENADLAVITSDNPRTEDPEAIIADILRGVEGTQTSYVVIPDRRAAIRWAMDHAQKEKLGVNEWDSCDIDRIGLDAAELLEGLVEAMG